MNCTGGRSPRCRTPISASGDFVAAGPIGRTAYYIGGAEAVRKLGPRKSPERRGIRKAMDELRKDGTGVWMFFRGGAVPGGDFYNCRGRGRIDNDGGVGRVDGG